MQNVFAPENMDNRRQQQRNLSMLTEDQKKILRTVYTKYSESHENFIVRNAQKRMMATVMTTLSKSYDGAERPDDYNTPIAVIEGPTGTGKTIGYLLGALPVALKAAKGKTIVISTATIALQEQLANIDLPEVAKHSGLKFNAVIAKGRRRYCCVQRLSNLVGDTTGELFDGEMVSTHVDEGYDELFADLDTAFRSGTWDGDSDNWTSTIPYQAWDKISTDAVGCTNSNCSSYRECPFFTARNNLTEADVIVANHDLVISALNNDGQILPDPESCFYIADEAHHIPNKSLNHNGASHQINSSIEWLEQSVKSVKATLSLLPNTRAADFLVDEDVIALKTALTEFKDAVSGMPELQPPAEKQRNNPTWRFNHGVLPDELTVLAQNARSASKSLCQKYSKLKEQIKLLLKQESISTDIADSMLPELGVYIGRSETIFETWDLMCKKDTSRQPPMVRWIELMVKTSGIDYLISVNAITVDTFLNQLMWDRFAGVILTSATLSTLGTFKRFAEQCGLQHQDDVTYLKLRSPFDYQNNAVLEVPAMKNNPSDRGHTDEITQWMNDNIDINKGTLVLFSSYWQMEQVKVKIADKIKRILLVQGDLPKQALLRKHKETIDQEYGSVLFGVASLAEGVDLKGDYLTHVIIAKLPFSVPDSPIYNATSEWLEANKKNPFMELSVPDASMKLIQGAGRLIRSETDTGKVSILDSRLLTKQYGQKMLDDLPPMKRKLGEG